MKTAQELAEKYMRCMIEMWDEGNKDIITEGYLPAMLESALRTVNLLIFNAASHIDLTDLKQYAEKYAEDITYKKALLDLDLDLDLDLGLANYEKLLRTAKSRGRIEVTDDVYLTYLSEQLYYISSKHFEGRSLIEDAADLRDFYNRYDLTIEQGH